MNDFRFPCFTPLHHFTRRRVVIGARPPASFLANGAAVGPAAVIGVGRGLLVAVRGRRLE